MRRPSPAASAAPLIGWVSPSRRLSGRIQSLERSVGQQLFERMGRGVRLTDSGHAFLPYAQRVFRTLEEGRRVLDGARHGTAGHLAIGTAPAVGAYVLPRLLKVFADTSPGVEVSVRTGHSEEILQLISSDDVHIGLGRPLVHPDTTTIELYRDELVLVVAPGHDFARRPMVNMAALAGEPLILFDRDSSYYSMVMATFQDMGVAPNHQMQLDSIEASKKMVEANLGVALLPAVSVEREIRLGTLHTVALETPGPLERAIGVMYRRARPRSGAVMAFLALLGKVYGREIA